jgi:hypothetical protein
MHRRNPIADLYHHVYLPVLVPNRLDLADLSVMADPPLLGRSTPSTLSRSWIPCELSARLPIPVSAGPADGFPDFLLPITFSRYVFCPICLV